MRAIVLGCGRLGSRLANLLDAEGHTVATIDRDAGTFEKLRPSFSGERIVGFGYDRQVAVIVIVRRCRAILPMLGRRLERGDVAR